VFCLFSWKITYKTLKPSPYDNEMKWIMHAFSLRKQHVSQFFIIVFNGRINKYVRVLDTIYDKYKQLFGSGYEKKLYCMVVGFGLL